MRELIKEKVRQRLTEQEKPNRTAAGVLVKCIETNRILLLLRNDKGDEPNTWALVSGGVDPGENVLEGLKREVHEEMMINPNIIEYKFINKTHIVQKNMDFYYFKGFTKSQFIPRLDHENMDFGWFDKDKLPAPLYPDLINNINNI